MASRRRGERLHADVHDRIVEFAKDSPWLSYAQIHAKLLDEARRDETNFGLGDVPTVRTVQNVGRPYRPASKENDRWQLASEATEGLVHIIEAGAYLTELSNGYAHVSVSEALWIPRIKQIVPQLHPRYVLSLARDLARLERREEDNTHVEYWLARARDWYPTQDQAGFAIHYARHSGIWPDRMFLFALNISPRGWLLEDLRRFMRAAFEYGGDELVRAGKERPETPARYTVAGRSDEPNALDKLKFDVKRERDDHGEKI